MANYDLRVSNSNQTRYHIASVSKPDTAAAISTAGTRTPQRVRSHFSLYPRLPIGFAFSFQSSYAKHAGEDDYRKVTLPSSEASQSNSSGPHRPFPTRRLCPDDRESASPAARAARWSRVESNAPFAAECR